MTLPRRPDAEVLAPLLTLLQQGGSQQQAVQSAMLWAGILGGAVIVLGVAMLIVRGRTFRDRNNDSGGGVFEDLRRMRDRGELSDEEFEQLRKAMADRLRGRKADRATTVSIRPEEARVASGEGIVAKPGYDLTGRPLPGFQQARSTDRPPGDA